jgi:hypothetical protein
MLPLLRLWLLRLGPLKLMVLLLMLQLWPHLAV